MVTMLGRAFCGGIGGYAGRRAFLWWDCWLLLEKGIFVVGLMATLREGHFEAGMVTMLGRAFCGGIGGYIGRRAAKLRES
jgi:hypothetical protein